MTDHNLSMRQQEGSVPKIQLDTLHIKLSSNAIFANLQTNVKRDMGQRKSVANGVHNMLQPQLRLGAEKGR